MLELTGNAIFGTGLAIGLSVGGAAFVLSLAIFSNINRSLRMRCKITEASREGAVSVLKSERKKAFDEALDTLKLVTEMRTANAAAIYEVTLENMRLQRLVEKTY